MKSDADGEGELAEADDSDLAEAANCEIAEADEFFRRRLPCVGVSGAQALRALLG